MAKVYEVTFEDLLQQIGKRSGINESYIEAVLCTLEKVMIDQLSHGR